MKKEIKASAIQHFHAKSHLQKCTTFCSVSLAPVACLCRYNCKIKSILRTKIPAGFLAGPSPVAFCHTTTSVYQFVML